MTDEELEARKPHLVQEEVTYQPTERGCVAHAWWSRRLPTVEARLGTPEKGGRLLAQPQLHRRIRPPRMRPLLGEWPSPFKD
jgi:hypothetical protein